jgi:hypothetical protein
MNKTECSKKVVGWKIRTENGEFMSLDHGCMFATSNKLLQTVFTLKRLRTVFRLGWFDKDTDILVAVWGES